VVDGTLVSYETYFRQPKTTYISYQRSLRSVQQVDRTPTVLTIRSTIDLLIAQIALEHHATLLHNDRDFDAVAQVCGLKAMTAIQA
jgi:hypothetical protein